MWMIIGAVGAVFGAGVMCGSASAVSTVSISLTQATASLSISPKDSRGTFNKTTSGIAFNVNTNNYSGYTLSIRASGNGTNAANLTQNITSNPGTGNETTTTYTIQSIGTVTGVGSTGIDEATFSGANNTQYNNKWGYQPNKLNSQNNSNYLPAPTGNSDNNAITLDSTSASGNSDYTINIGARVDNTIPMGQYSNTFVVTAVANLINYTITYDKGNTQDTVTNLPSNQTGIVEHPDTNTDITLISDTPSRAGKSFVGWCSELPTAGDTDTCGGTTYAAGGTYLLNPAISPNVTLYAMWGPPPPLYNLVAAMSKGKQTNDGDATTGIQAGIVTPTKAAPISSNSGVYEYDASVFGEASDVANTSTIYYYRGILDSYGNTGSYGSDGLADAYPNYVILDADGTKDTSATCWRIVRTTGSGGVKMIYNGKWTGSTCANAQANAQVGFSAFNTYSTAQQMVSVGYTYNSTYATNTARSGTIAEIFGTNSTSSVNDTRSDIKAYIEDTWYANNMTAYTSILEPSAGYCNDRTMNTSDDWTAPLAESSTIAATYGTSSLQAYYFGAYVRNMKTNQPPSLTCAKYSNVDRSMVDLYRYDGINNAAGSITANYLKYPAALLTVDELSFAGSGSVTATNGSSYHAESYLHSGGDFWLLSPSRRNSNGGACGFYLNSSGYLDNFQIVGGGVRPAISLKPGTTAASGAGTAIDPWVVTAP